MNNRKTPHTDKERRIPETIKLSDASCHPGLDLIEAITERRPTREALAMLDAWKFRFQPYSFKTHPKNRYISNV